MFHEAGNVYRKLPPPHTQTLQTTIQYLFPESCALLGITQRVVVIPYRRFGTNYRSHLQGSKDRSLKMGRNRMYRNVGKNSPTTSWVITQKRAVLICFQAETCNHQCFARVCVRESWNINTFFFLVVPTFSKEYRYCWKAPRHRPFIDLLPF